MLSRLSGYFKQNVVGFLALFVALGGSAYAVNTVRSTDIVDGEVASVDIKNQDIVSADVKDQSLTTFDVSTFLGVDVVDGTLTGADVGDESLTGADIASESITRFQIGAGEVDSQNLGTNSVWTNEVQDGALNDEDIAEGTFVAFAGFIGVVPAHSCVTRVVTGVNAQGDHLILTPSGNSASPSLTYSAQSHNNDQNMEIKACNPTPSAIDDGTNTFSLLVIDAN